MAARQPLLILLALGVLFGLPGRLAAAPVRCLDCHPVHHAERGSCVSCHRGNPSTDRREIAHSGMIPGALAHFTLGEGPVLERGRQLLEKAGCRRCHVSGGKGNRLAADLDRALSARPLASLEAIRRPALFMPDFRFGEPELAALVNALLEGAVRIAPEKGERPLVVHFERGLTEKDAFTRRCGGCHRALTSLRGGLGTGRVGPDLSGLFTPFYPVPFREKEGWGPKNLEKWLENPRKVRPLAVMPPLRLETEADKAELLGILADGGKAEKAGH